MQSTDSLTHRARVGRLQRGRAIRFRRSIFNLTLAGLPELDRFPDDEARQRAIAAARDEVHFITGTRGWRGCLLYVAAVGLAVFAYLVAVQPALRVLLPNWTPSWGDALLHGVIGLVVLAIAIRWAHRHAARPVLRQQLIRLGVPICNGCGYDLRGQAADCVQCPECGRVIEIDIRLLLKSQHEKQK